MLSLHERIGELLAECGSRLIRVGERMAGRVLVLEGWRPSDYRRVRRAALELIYYEQDERWMKWQPQRMIDDLLYVVDEDRTLAEYRAGKAGWPFSELRT